MRGNFKLDGKWYKGYASALPNQALASQMVSKIGQGNSQYSDLSTWSAWIQQDWQEGVGRANPAMRGGYLYGEMDSRVPEQLCFPPKLHQADLRTITGAITDCRFIPEGSVALSTLTVTEGATSTRKVAVKFTTPATVATVYYHFYVMAAPETQIKLSLYSDSSGPNTLIDSDTVITPNVRGFHWLGVALGATSSTTSYWLSIEPDHTPDATIYIAYATTGYATEAMAYNGSSWVSQTSVYPLYSSHHHQASVGGAGGSGFFRFNNKLYYYTGISLHDYDTVNGDWEVAATVSGQDYITCAVPFDTAVYFGSGDGDDYNTMNTSEVTAQSSDDAFTFYASETGYLYRAYQDYVEYSGDGSTWEPTATITPGEPIYVCAPHDQVMSMCELGGLLYVATQRGLVIVYPGDISKRILSWNAQVTDNGIQMLDFEGQLYVLAQGRLLRVSEDGSYQDVWIKEDGYLRGMMPTKVWSITRGNNWLMALASSDYSFTVWAYQNNAWHYIATLPTFTPNSVNKYYNTALYYDRPTSKLWASVNGGVTYWWRIPDVTRNPLNDLNFDPEKSAWMEWDWFDSTVLEAQKDYESVTIIADGLRSPDQYADVYWKDDDSTAWEYLGRIDSGGEELRWDIDRGDRPNTKRFKLGIHFVNGNGNPIRIRAIRVKYHLMVTDRFRWSLQVDVSGREGHEQTMLEGVNTESAALIKAALDTTIRSVAPVIYQDVDETEYEVKVLDANFSYTKQVYENDVYYWEGVYRITIEAVTEEEYVA